MKKTVRRGPISQESPEIALEGLLRTELHAFALKAGLEVLGAMFESEREAVCGPRYRHIEGRKSLPGCSRAGGAGSGRPEGTPLPAPGTRSGRTRGCAPQLAGVHGGRPAGRARI